MTTTSKGLLPKTATRYSTTQKVREKQNSGVTSKGRHVLIKKNVKLMNKLKRPLRKQHRSNRLINKSYSHLVTKSPPEERQSNVTNARVPQVLWIKHPTGAPNGDFDEIFTEDGALSRNTVQDEALLQKLREDEKDLGSDKPITNDSDDSEKEDHSAADRLSVGKAARKQANEASLSLAHVREEGRITHDKDKLDEEENVSKEVSTFKEKQHTSLPQEDEDDESEDVDDKEPEEDRRKTSHAIEDKLLGALNKMGQDKNHNTEPVEISDHINPALMSSLEEKQGQISAFTGRERQLQALRELQIKEMLQRLRLSYGKTIAQSTAQLPQYFSPQVGRVPQAFISAPLFLVPTVPIYQPAYVAPSPSSSSPTQADNQGYTINVDGLKGVFSKEPGFVLRFHSPSSDVTVVKKKDQMVTPMTGNQV